MADVPDTTTSSATLVADALLNDLQPAVAAQDSVLTTILNLQTTLCKQVEALTAKLDQIPRDFGNATLITQYRHKIHACRARLLAVNRKLDVVEHRLGQAEAILEKE